MKVGDVLRLRELMQEGTVILADDPEEHEDVLSLVGIGRTLDGLEIETYAILLLDSGQYQVWGSYIYRANDGQDKYERLT